MFKIWPKLNELSGKRSGCRTGRSWFCHHVQTNAVVRPDPPALCGWRVKRRLHLHLASKLRMFEGFVWYLGAGTTLSTLL